MSKRFNLRLALRGHPVQLNGGFQAYITRIDRSDPVRPFVGYYINELKDGVKESLSWRTNGKVNTRTRGSEWCDIIGLWDKPNPREIYESLNEEIPKSFNDLHIKLGLSLNDFEQMLDGNKKFPLRQFGHFLKKCMVIHSRENGNYLTKHLSDEDRAIYRKVGYEKLSRAIFYDYWDEAIKVWRGDKNE